VTVHVSDDLLVLVTVLGDGTMTVATRTHPDAIWSPPVVVRPEATE
jgi:hypothetical protein